MSGTSIIAQISMSLMSNLNHSIYGQSEIYKTTKKYLKQKRMSYNIYY